MSDIYVISTGRNASNFIINCIESVKSQTMVPKSHIVIDDISDDDTQEHLNKYIEHEGIEVKINEERKYRLKNLYDSIIDKDPEDIICIVDSDDWLARKDALKKVKETYDSDSKLEYVYTNYRRSHETTKGHGQAPPSNDWDPYKDDWISSHMSTFKVKALKNIPIANFFDWNGNWFRMATDFAYVLPMKYGFKKRDGDYSAMKYIDEVMYVYHFFNNPGKPRSGPEGEKLSSDAWQNSEFIRHRGYIEE